MHRYPLLLTLSWPRTCRYLPGDKLLQHVDGVQIDASIVIGLPTDKQWEGGGLTVWDGKPERQQFDYSMPPGSACFLDRMVWHQANPVTSGERWALVIFYKVRTGDAKGKDKGALPQGVAEEEEEGEVVVVEEEEE